MPQPYAPTPLDLITLWLEQHFKVPAVVFMHVDCDIEHRWEAIRHLFPQDQHSDLLFCEHAIRVCKTQDEAVRICNQFSAADLYCIVWDGRRVSHHNE